MPTLFPFEKPHFSNLFHSFSSGFNPLLTKEGRGYFFYDIGPMTKCLSGKNITKKPHKTIYIYKEHKISLHMRYLIMG